MNCYSSLARWYDELTEDVPYTSFLDFYNTVFREDGGEFKLILDLCCGTGTLTTLLSEYGYDMIGVDASEEMLMEAQNNATQKGQNILFLCQEAANLDLYGTVDACISSLDSINYIPQNELKKLFSRLKLFIRPDGLLIFDIRSHDWLKSMDGSTFVDETDDVLCLWRADYDESRSEITYGMDIFSRKGSLWERESEFHTEYDYGVDFLSSALEEAGFSNPNVIINGPQGELGRIFLISRRL